MLQRYLPFLILSIPLLWLLVEAIKNSMLVGCSIYTSSEIFWLFFFNLVVATFIQIVLHAPKKIYPVIFISAVFIIFVLLMGGSRSFYIDAFESFVPSLPVIELLAITGLQVLGVIVDKITQSHKKTSNRRILSTILGLFASSFAFFILLFFNQDNASATFSSLFVVIAVPLLLFFEGVMEYHKDKVDILLTKS